MTQAKVRRPLQDTAFWQAYGAIAVRILFFALLLTLILMPIAAIIGLPPVLIKMLLAASLFAAVMPNATPHSRYVFMAAVGGLVIAQLASDYGFLPVNSGLVLALGGIICLLAAAGTLRFTITSNSVNSETSMRL